MVKHIQTVRRQIADELLEFVSPFCEIGAKRVNIVICLFVLTDVLCSNSE